MSRASANSILMFCVAVSIFGMFLITFWAIDPPTSGDDLFWRKPLIGSLFSLICILGIFASLFPSRCSEAFHFRGAMADAATRQTLNASHHPDCEGFLAHVVCIKGRVRCAACTGLLLGAVIALIGDFYFFSGLQIENARFLSLIGVVGVLIGFLQLRFTGYVRLASNSLFVLGASFCLVGIDQVSQSVAIDLFSVMLIVFWILTRIQLSQWDHSRICDNCDSPCRIGRKMEGKLVSAARSEYSADEY